MQWQASWNTDVCYSMCEQEHRLEHLPAANRRSKENWSEGHLADASQQRWHRIKTINHSTQRVTCTGTAVRYMHSCFTGVCNLWGSYCRKCKASDVRLVYCCFSGVSDLWSFGCREWQDAHLSSACCSGVHSPGTPRRQAQTSSPSLCSCTTPQRRVAINTCWLTWSNLGSLLVIVVYQKKTHRKGARSVQNVKAAPKRVGIK